MAGLPAITCPGCGFAAPIEVFAGDRDARFAFALMGKVPPPLSDAVLRYLALFAPAKHRLTWSRVRTLLAPLVEAIERGSITRARRDWTLSLAHWEQGLQHMAEKRTTLTLPLKSHGYLWEVLVGLVDKVEARAEHQQIADDRTGASRREAVEPSGAGAWDAERKQLAERSRALSLAAGEMKSVARLGIAHTEQSLRTHLVDAGIDGAAATFVARQLFTPKTPAALPPTAPPENPQ